MDRGEEAAPIGRWGLAEIERLFALWHRFRAGEFARPELLRRATCRQQGQRLLDFLVAAGEAALQGTAAPSLLPNKQDR